MMRALFIINPSSGRQNMRPQLEKIIGRLSLMQKLKEVDVFYTQKKDDAFLRAKILQPRDYDFVVAVGGDGTVNEVIGGIITSGCDIPLAIIAGGTVNDFANYLHLPKTPEAFCRMIDDFQTRYVDVGRIGDAYFANVVAAGALFSATGSPYISVLYFIGCRFGVNDGIDIPPAGVGFYDCMFEEAYNVRLRNETPDAPIEFNNSSFVFLLK